MRRTFVLKIHSYKLTYFACHIITVDTRVEMRIGIFACQLVSDILCFSFACKVKASSVRRTQNVVTPFLQICRIHMSCNAVKIM